VVLFVWLVLGMNSCGFKWALAFVVLLACVVKLTSSLECYNCETSRNGFCGPYFDKDINEKRTCNNGGICRTHITKDKGKLSQVSLDSRVVVSYHILVGRLV